VTLPSLDLDALFPDASMFASRETWRAAGFDVIDRDANKRIMVAAHAAAPSCLFKKFPNEISAEDQLESYQIRVDGADALRDFISEHRLSGVVVPDKQIVDLGGTRGALVIVDRLDLMTDEDARKAYGLIDDQTFTDLCVVLYTFRGLDSGVRNLSLTKSGQIGFIDTERSDDERDRPYFKHIRRYLTRGQISMANTVFKQLRSAEIAARRDDHDP
jgi:hypothetical protein